MAKALFNRLAQERGIPFRAESAGTEHADHVYAQVAEVMRELDIDLSGERPKLLTNGMVEQASRVVTMGCAVDAGACPAVLVKRDMEDWGLPDPKGKSMDGVRVIRDVIRQKVERLLDSASSPTLDSVISGS